MTAGDPFRKLADRLEEKWCECDLHEIANGGDPCAAHLQDVPVARLLADALDALKHLEYSGLSSTKICPACGYASPVHHGGELIAGGHAIDCWLNKPLASAAGLAQQLGDPE